MGSGRPPGRFPATPRPPGRGVDVRAGVSLQPLAPLGGGSTAGGGGRGQPLAQEGEGSRVPGPVVLPLAP
jgi:hypothetical protein